MCLAGVLYLVFEDSLLSLSKTQSRKASDLSRTIIGIQTGLVALAIAVTRSSILSLQARQGLPLGNQVTGWLLFSELCYRPYVLC